MAASLRDLYGASTPTLNAIAPMASLASASPQRILDLSRYGVRPYDIGGTQFLTQPTAAVSKILGNPLDSIHSPFFISPLNLIPFRFPALIYFDSFHFNFLTETEYDWFSSLAI